MLYVRHQFHQRFTGSNNIRSSNLHFVGVLFALRYLWELGISFTFSKFADFCKRKKERELIPTGDCIVELAKFNSEWNTSIHVSRVEAQVNLIILSPFIHSPISKQLYEIWMRTYLQSSPACFSHLLLVECYMISEAPLSIEVNCVETSLLYLQN